MNYTEAVNFIHSRQRLSSTPGLERIERITSMCGYPQRSMRFIHIAGTNGKGSTSVMLSNILTAAGYRTGLSTSPYITDFRERFRINGQMISEKELAQTVSELYPIITALDNEGLIANEFEVVVAITLMWFAKRKCDYAVLEVGLGGRFDATNVIPAPDCAVITHIDLDHTDLLGDTVDKIAAEKCGIIKKGSKVVAYPCQYDGAMQVIESACRDKGCPLTVPQIPDFEGALTGSRFNYKGIDYHLPLVGEHQLNNAVTAIEAARAIGIEDDYIRQGVAMTQMPARVEVISQSPPVILDGAHNPDGMKALCKALDLLENVRPVAIMGMLRDKDISGAVKEVAHKFHAIVAVPVDSPRAMPPEELKKVLDSYCDNVCTADNLQNALVLADEIRKDRPLVVCGSLYLASQIRPMLTQKQNM